MLKSHIACYSVVLACLACLAQTKVSAHQIDRGGGINGREEKLEMQQALSAGAAWMNCSIIPISETSITVTDWGGSLIVISPLMLRRCAMALFSDK